ncbi:thiamine pyrophosphate-dependent dehydrogenase E1 component subunit alpha [Nakamurella flavida]|uniref:Thiamine pyrophosphate-dependent dehydrogenase E1 component subunit alpha n=1 Tax=Nakamurella flavida TaxID=363630 RepID=A0A938YKW7_9ACTN|nr:thiamine pyrophosphate-dependent dehydrogenase E1 component subunit alpha [Nakamurella flavida]MBM9477877.1 thiamine pyrophosphate-dependent dehydrogenase E1 component subunit alpha [Nakamurella flavida]MDP9778409.1 pyruvate dehydrogenase E1 component alpha subunit [Nakamurella flavida]
MTATSTTLPLPDVASADLREWLSTMVLVRTFEEAADGLALRGKIPGGMHPAIGQEAVAVGAARALRSGDIVTGTHRSHHHALAKGMSPAGVLAELYGKAGGSNGGRGGSMHLADFDLGLWGSNGIVGGGLGIALGAALGAEVLGSEQISLGFFGDGGANTGRVWEFTNLAAIWSLPLVIVCENNLYAVETISERVTGGGDITARAAGFGLPAHQIDGQDVVAVHRAVRDAAEQARSGGGPTFLEVRTYRYKGHDSGQVIRYRTEDEVQRWRTSRDPIENFTARLTDAGVLTADEMSTIVEQARRMVDAAVAFAEESPWPDPCSAAENVSAWNASPGTSR